MTEKTKQALEKPDKPESAKKTTDTHSTKQRSQKLALTGLLIALAASFGAVFSFIQLQLRDNSLNQKLLATNKSVNDLVDKQQQFKQAITQANQTAKKQMEALGNELKECKKSMKEMSAGSRNLDAYWQLKKAQFYLQLAQINAHWSQQPQTTIDLLKQADFLLSDRHQPDIYDVRQQIATDIAAIEKQSKVDVVGLLTQINIIQAHIKQLSYQDDPLLADKSKEDQQEKAQRETWRQHMANSVNALKKLVIIRHHERSVKPILSDIQFSLVKEAFYVQLQQAKWAVIHRNQDVFKLTIEQTIKQIQHQFNQQQPLVSKIIKALKSLQQIQIEQKTLEPNKALLMLNKHIQSSDDTPDQTASSGGKH